MSSNISQTALENDKMKKQLDEQFIKNIEMSLKMI